jgi:hypothetical protein
MESGPPTEIHMTWRPTTLAELNNLIATGESEMSEEYTNIWNLVRITPVKWKEKPYGKRGGGFWAVGIYGAKVIWYNDIEEGFNISSYIKYGEIAEYWCNPDTLYQAIHRIAHAVHTGRDTGYSYGPPQPVRL